MATYTFGMSRDEYVGSFIDGARNDAALRRFHIQVSHGSGRDPNHYNITITDRRGRTLGTGTYDRNRDPPYQITINEDVSEINPSLAEARRALVGAMQNHGLTATMAQSSGDNMASATAPPTRAVRPAPVAPRPVPARAHEARERFQEAGRGQVRIYTLTADQVRAAQIRLANLNPPMSLDIDLGIQDATGARIGGTLERGNVRRTVRRELEDFERVTDSRRARTGAPDGVGVGGQRTESYRTVRIEQSLVGSFTFRLDNSESPEAFNEAVAALDSIPGVRAQRTPAAPEPRPLTGNQARVTLTGRQFDEAIGGLTATYDDDVETGYRPYALSTGRTYENGMAQEVTLRDPAGRIIARGIRHEGAADHEDQVVLTFLNGRVLEPGEQGSPNPLRNALASVDALGLVERREATPIAAPAEQKQQVAQSTSPRSNTPISQAPSQVLIPLPDDHRGRATNSPAKSPNQTTIHLGQHDFLRLARNLPRGYRIDSSGDHTVFRDCSGTEVGSVTFDPSRFNPSIPISTTITSSDPNLIAALNQVVNQSVNDRDGDRRVARR